jgi:hypothetical protein
VEKTGKGRRIRGEEEKKVERGRGKKALRRRRRN